MSAEIAAARALHRGEGIGQQAADEELAGLVGDRQGCFDRLSQSFSVRG